MPSTTPLLPFCDDNSFYTDIATLLLSTESHRTCSPSRPLLTNIHFMQTSFIYLPDCPYAQGLISMPKQCALDRKLLIGMAAH